jgi:hypothetical protein
MSLSYPAAVREAILDRISDGEHLTHVCREAGMPCHESVTGWMRRDPEFAQAVAAARAQGDWNRRLRFDPERAERLLARLRGGEAINDLLRDRAMPSRATFDHWKATELAFAEAVGRLIAEKAATRPWAKRRYRPYDAEIGERIYRRLWMGETLRAVLRSDRAFPSLMVFARWRRQDAGFDEMMGFVLGAWRRKRPSLLKRLTPKLYDAVRDGLVQGESLRSLSQRRDMPCARTLYAWVAKRPEFAAMVERACEGRVDWFFDHMLEMTGSGPPMSIKAMRARTAPLVRQEVRLRKRPGWKRRAGGWSKTLR